MSCKGLTGPSSKPWSDWFLSNVAAAFFLFFWCVYAPTAMPTTASTPITIPAIAPPLNSKIEKREWKERKKDEQKKEEKLGDKRKKENDRKKWDE